MDFWTNVKEEDASSFEDESFTDPHSPQVQVGTKTILSSARERAKKRKTVETEEEKASRLRKESSRKTAACARLSIHATDLMGSIKNVNDVDYLEIRKTSTSPVDEVVKEEPDECESPEMERPASVILEESQEDQNMPTSSGLPENPFDLMVQHISRGEGMDLQSFRAHVANVGSQLDPIVMSHAVLNSNAISDTNVKSAMSLLFLSMGSVARGNRAFYAGVRDNGEVKEGEAELVLSELFEIAEYPSTSDPMQPGDVIVPECPPLRAVNVRSAIKCVSNGFSVKSHLLRDALRDVLREVFKQAIPEGTSIKFTFASKAQRGMTAVPIQFVNAISRVVSRHVRLRQDGDLSSELALAAKKLAAKYGISYWDHSIKEQIAYVLKKSPNRKQDNSWAQYSDSEYQSIWELDPNVKEHPEIRSLMSDTKPWPM